ncbi:MAG: hypothetical protein AAGB31_00765 [Bdellovibrio sp.]
MLTRYFEQADSIHREAWWVISGERSPLSKSPFGKVHRALLTLQNMKLSNKSIFRCDRYLVQRDVMKSEGFPQKLEIFEKCNDKIPAKKLAVVNAPRSGEASVTFYSENLAEVLGMGATILNKPISCILKGDAEGHLQSLSCKDWIQERAETGNKNRWDVILNVYEYQREGKNVIKLRGKVHENLTETRKLEADVPMEGKIFVTETELYPPEPTPTVTPTPTTAGAPVAVPAPRGARSASPSGGAVPVAPIPPGVKPSAPAAPGAQALPAEGIPVTDPDVIQQLQLLEMQKEYSQEHAPEDSEQAPDAESVDPESSPASEAQEVPGLQPLPQAPGSNAPTVPAEGFSEPGHEMLPYQDEEASPTPTPAPRGR